jgi:dolichol-phosphate mannosyltransferase
MALDLALVIPVYNEESCILRVIRSWRALLTEMGISHKIIVLNDGSRDSTAAQLENLRDDPDVELIHQINAGHGPTILRGYRRAVELADWVFQCDSDEEIQADHFPAFWQNRDGKDGVFGVRQQRSRAASRVFISAGARSMVTLLFGNGIHDVNVPYRLMRSSFLKRLIEDIPTNTLAPNIILSGWFARTRRPLLEIPVPCKGRHSGRASLARFRLWQFAVMAFLQVLRSRFRTQADP